MAKNEKSGTGSHEPDMFDDPPKGPAGVHRGARSVAARVTPFVVVVLVAALCGFAAWGVFSGEFGKMRMPWSSSQTSASSASGSSSSSSSKPKKTTDSSSDATDKASSSASSSSDASSTDASKDDAASTDQNAGQQASDQQAADQQAQQAAQPDKTKGVSVVNGTSITGYAASKQSALAAAGYTNVSSSNPNGMGLPGSTVVWYASQDDQATAQDVANALGITDVQQVDGLGTPVVVVLMN